MLAKFQSAQAPRHWKAMQHVVRYVKGTIGYGLHYKRMKSAPTLTAWTDADWARDIDTRRSRTGYAVFICGTPFSWCSKIQSSVAMSNAEAEFDALLATVREVI